MIKCALLILEYVLTSIGSQGTWRERFKRTGLISPCTLVFNELITSETWTQFSFEWFRLTNFYTMIFTDMNLNPKCFLYSLLNRLFLSLQEVVWVHWRLYDGAICSVTTTFNSIDICSWQWHTFTLTYIHTYTLANIRTYSKFFKPCLIYS